MKSTTIPTGSFEANCTILSGDGKAWIVDPGGDARRIAALVRETGCAPAGILLTHAHFDHIGAIPELQAIWPGLPVYVHKDDAKVIAHALNQVPPDYPPIPLPENVRTEGWPDFLEVIETPGHTPGGVCYYLKQDSLLLSGDTLFAGSVGRTDLPGGHMPTLMASLAKLVELPGDTRVVPGHGPQTTIGLEKESNPFLAGR